MKNIVTVLGYTFLAVIVLATAATGVLFLYGKKLDEESRVYADAATLAIATDWSVPELRKRASREFDADADYEDIADYFGELRRLGKFVNYGGSSGQSTITVSLRYGYEITADYGGTIELEDGSADIQMSLIKLDGRWQVLDLRITPRAFADDKNVVRLTPVLRPPHRG